MKVQARGIVIKCEMREAPGGGFMTKGHRFTLVIQGVHLQEGDLLVIPGAISVYSTHPMSPGTRLMVSLDSPISGEEKADASGK